MARQAFKNNRERFKTLAEQRTNNVIKALEVLSHCSNKALYTYKQDEIEKIYSAIGDAFVESKARFKEKKKEKFKLDRLDD